jgi:thiol:disulfide interchange protein DsbC
MKRFIVLTWTVLLATTAGMALSAPQQTPADPPAQKPSAPPSAPAVTPSQQANVSAEVLKSVASVAGEGVKQEDVRTTPIAGIYEIHRGADVLYMTQDGKYALIGELYAVSNHSNLTEARRSELRRQLIETLPESKMVVFSPAQPKYTVTVFTDVDCPYCRALHNQIADYNKLGVSVRYVFFPRSGPDTESWHKAEQIWCSADRKAALTQAKAGKPLESKVCAGNPVAQEYELGKAIGLEGTPGIVAANGAMIGGYLPPEKLVEELKQLQP